MLMINYHLHYAKICSILFEYRRLFFGDMRWLKQILLSYPLKLYELLSSLDADERSRVIQATLVLFGEEKAQNTVPPGNASMNSNQRNSILNNAGAFFDSKEPKNKGEELAVAARFRELKQDGKTHSKTDFKQIVTDARRNFDSSNFSRDLDNAKRQAGFFNLGTDREASQLSYYGQQYVDALPDREAVAKLRRPKIKKGTKKKTKAKKIPK